MEPTEPPPESVPPPDEATPPSPVELPEPYPPPDELDRPTLPDPDSDDEDDVPRLLFFYRPDEGAGRKLESLLAQVLQRRRNHSTFDIHRIDASERADLAARFRIDRTPAILVVADDKVRARITRPKKTSDLRQHLQPWLR